MILTPDQRLRVFISSTLEELAEEREAVRRAVESLQLTPVMFELGARPHAPRNLYRAYVEQSHLFVAVYWQRYGWVVPELEISGLEDEYRLAERLPRLVYVKEPAPEREAELARLIERLEREAAVSYKRFSDAAELERVVRDDLAALLAERFAAAGRHARAPVPAPAAPLVGRRSELAEVIQLFENGDARLVTLTGPGGVGKSRLAIEVARTLDETFPGGAFFVPLEPVEHAAAVPSAVVRALGLAPTGAESEHAAIGDLLGESRALLYLDNFEQVLDAAGFVADLLSACPSLAILVTSRAALHVRGEREYDVKPLDASDAVQLFVDRARSVRSDFTLDEDGEAAVAEICGRLDGLPLAIELAAARMKLFTPQELVERLGDRLELAAGERRDLPARHQALRTTIAWSYDLLSDAEGDLFARVGALRGPFTLDAAEAICAGSEIDVVAGLSSLIDKSLVAPAAGGLAPRFSMLETIHEFALRMLDASPFAAEVRRAHSRYFVRRALAAHKGLRDARQAAWQEALEAEAADLTAAFDWWLEHEDADTMAEVASSLWVFWWLAGYLGEGRALVERILARQDELSPIALARALATRAAVAFFQADYGQSVADGTAARGRFEALGDKAGMAYSLAFLGVLHVSATGGAAGVEELRSAVRLLEAEGDRWGAVRTRNALHWAQYLIGKLLESDEEYRATLAEAHDLGSPQEISMAQANLGRYHVSRGEPDAGLVHLLDALEAVAGIRHKGAIALIFESTVEAARGLGEPVRAVHLFAAANAIRKAIGAPAAPAVAARNERNATALKEALGTEAFEREWAAGAGMSLDDALAEAQALTSTK